MTFEEEGKRLRALDKTIRAVTKAYSSIHAPTDGVRAIRFLNSNEKFDGVKPEDLDQLHIKTRRFRGNSKVATALKNQVFKEFIPENGQLENPLLIMVLTDGAVCNLPSESTQ